MVSAEVRARHPSLPRRPAPSGGRKGSRAAWAACALALLALAGSGAVPADTSNSQEQKKAKASSFAPHHGKNHVYGSPVSKPVLHKRKKAAPPRPAREPAEPIK